MSKTNDKIPSERPVNFVELAIIHHRIYDLTHILGFIGVIRNHFQ